MIFELLPIFVPDIFCTSFDTNNFESLTSNTCDQIIYKLY